MPVRRQAKKDLVPWRRHPEHDDGRTRRMLHCEGRPQAPQERLLGRVMSPGQGKLMVVARYPRVRTFVEPCDQIRIVRPAADDLTEFGLPRLGLRCAHDAGGPPVHAALVPDQSRTTQPGRLGTTASGPAVAAAAERRACGAQICLPGSTTGHYAGRC